MNILEHYIVKIFEERPLTKEESEGYEEYNMNPDDFLYVSWEYNCYGNHNICNEIIKKSRWETIKEKGYDLR